MKSYYLISCDEYKKQKSNYFWYYATPEIATIILAIIGLFNYEKIVVFLEQFNVVIAGALLFTPVLFIVLIKMFIEAQIDKHVAAATNHSLLERLNDVEFEKWFKEYDSFYLSLHGYHVDSRDATRAWDKISK